MCTNPSRTGRRKFVERLSQQDFWIADGVSYRVVLLLSSEGELRERRLVARRVFDVYEMLVVWDAVVFWQLKQTNERLEQRRPSDTTNCEFVTSTLNKRKHFYTNHFKSMENVTLS